MLKQIGYYGIVGLLGLALGYYLMPKKEVIKTVEKQVDRVITIIKRPDGTVEKVITDKSKISSNETTKINARSKYSLGVLVGTDFKGPQYGAYFNKEFLGPVTLGAFGTMSPDLNRGNIGLSIGLNF
jgi:hypothetical protein